MRHQLFAAKHGVKVSPRYPNMRDRKILVYTTEYVWEDGAEEPTRDGEADVEVIGCEPDRFDYAEGDYTAVHMAARHLDSNYVWQSDASSEPYMPGSWYLTSVEDHYQDRKTEKTFHLYGFAPSEEARIYRMLRSAKSGN